MMSLVYRLIALGLFFMIYVIGLIGNGLLICKSTLCFGSICFDVLQLNLVIVFRQKNLRTVPNLLVVSLALGDFLFVFFCVPFGAVAYTFDYYPFPTSYCRFENFIINLSLGVSVFSLLALSEDRYKIIVTPFSSHANDPSIKLKTVVISLWLISVALALPETFYSGESLMLSEDLEQRDEADLTTDRKDRFAYRQWVCQVIFLNYSY
jgi:bombesin receptor subtype-3